MIDLIAKRIDDLHTFDPNDIELLVAQDECMQDTSSYEGPGISVAQIQAKSIVELERFVDGLRAAVKLPLHTPFIRGMTVILGFSQEELRVRRMAEERRQAAIRRAKAEGRYIEWEHADLYAEIEAVAGAGRRAGKEAWFSCPFGHSTGQTPSLHVNIEARTWHCFGCQRGGGVTHWRREIRK